MYFIDKEIDKLINLDLFFELQETRDFWEKVLEKTCELNYGFRHKYHQDLNLILNSLMDFFKRGFITPNDLEIIKEILYSKEFRDVFSKYQEIPDVIEKIGGIQTIINLLIEVNRREIGEILKRR